MRQEKLLFILCEEQYSSQALAYWLPLFFLSKKSITEAMYPSLRWMRVFVNLYSLRSVALQWLYFIFFVYSNLDS
jgi:hypothetical protein